MEKEDQNVFLSLKPFPSFHCAPYRSGPHRSCLSTAPSWWEGFLLSGKWENSRGVIKFCRGDLWDGERPCRVMKMYKWKGTPDLPASLKLQLGQKTYSRGSVPMWTVWGHASCSAAVPWCSWCKLRWLLLLISMVACALFPLCSRWVPGAPSGGPC